MWSLLATQPDLREKIEALGVDQKAIVEYHIQIVATYQLGIITSSMSALIAYARTVDDEDDLFEMGVFPGSARIGLRSNHFAGPEMRIGIRS